MNLKLAEYKDGKFERFLELDCLNQDSGKTFSFSKDYVEVIDYDNLCHETYLAKTDFYLKDEKDPLNRFNGLFDGRTYGEGRFVLIKDDEDDVYSKLDYDGYDDIFVYTMEPAIHDDSFNICGNLHKNPELFKQIN